MATSKAARDTPPQQHPPRAQKPQAERPALGGAKSLREALEQATGHKAEKPGHAPDLKDTLSRVASTPAPKKEDASGGLSEQELRTMLAVDEIDGQS